MSKHVLLTVALASTLALFGCDSLKTGVPVQSASSGKLVLQPQIQDGGFSTAAVVAPYAKTSVNHLVLKLFTLAGEVETAAVSGAGTAIVLDLTNSELDNPVTINQLKANTTYRVRAFAYKAAGTAAGDLISTSDAGSYVDVAVSNDDAPPMSTLKVKLINRLFSGSGTSSGVAVTAGGYTPVGTETFGLLTTGSITTAPSTGSLAYTIGYCTPVRIGNYLYIPGGQSTNQVQRASLQADGSLSSFSVVSGVTLANTLRGYTTAVIGDYLYVFGGNNASNNTFPTTVQRAAIAADGSIGNFSDAGVSLTTPRWAGGLYVGGGYVYLIGGGSDGVTAQNSIERAAINSDGTLGSFSVVSGLTLTKARQQFATVVHGSKVYVLGGAQGSNDNTVESATINADGTLGSFATESSMTIKRGSPGAAVIGGKLYAFAGFSATGPVNSIERTTLNADGSLGAWSTVSGVTTAEANYGEGGLVAGNSFYMFHDTLSQRFLIQ